MRKFLTTGLFSAILGIVIGGAPADASLVSRSFLDQALTDYATTTALDLKANQSDFTDLNTQISGSVDVLRQLFEQTSNSYEFVKGINPEKFPNTISGAFTLLHQYLDVFAGSFLYGWADSEGNTYLGVKGLNDKIGTLPSGSLTGNSPAMDALFKFTQDTDTPVFPNSLSDLINQLYGSTGVPGAITALLYGFDFTLGEYNGLVGVLPAMELGISANTAANTALATADANTAKIGDLPTEIVIGNSNGPIDMFNITKSQRVSLPEDYTLSDFIQDMYYGRFGVNAGLDSSPFYGLSDIIYHVMYGGIIGEATPDLTGNQYKGLIDLTREINKISALPEGITVQGMLEGWTDENGVLANPGLKGIYEGWVGQNGQHTLGLQELELDSFYIYNPENDSPQELRGQKGGLLYVLSSLLNDSGYSVNVGALAPFWKLTQSVYKTDELSAKIGTLPSGSLLNVWDGRTDNLYKSAQHTDTPVYPTSLEEFMLQIYGIPGTPLGVVPNLVANIDGLKTTATTANETANAAKSTAQANAVKIGTLPSGGISYISRT